MTPTDIEAYGLRRLEDVIDKATHQPRALFTKYITSNGPPHFLWIWQASNSDLSWRIVKDEVTIVTVGEPSQLEAALFVLTGFKYTTWTCNTTLEIFLRQPSGENLWGNAQLFGGHF